MTIRSLTLAAAGVFAVVGLAACEGGEREAEAETPVAAAEVETSLPESTVSDQELQQAADQAAANASTPAPGTVGSSTTVTGSSTTTTVPQ